MKKRIIGLLLATSLTVFAGENEAKRISENLMSLSQNSSLSVDEISRIAYAEALTIKQFLNTAEISGEKSKYDSLITETSEKLLKWSQMAEEGQIDMNELKSLIASRSRVMQQFILKLGL